MAEKKIYKNFNPTEQQKFIKSKKSLNRNKHSVSKIVLNSHCSLSKKNVTEGQNNFETKYHCFYFRLKSGVTVVPPALKLCPDILPLKYESAKRLIHKKIKNVSTTPDVLRCFERSGKILSILG